MRYSEVDIQRIMASIMKEDDTFEFGCKICGDCCRNRQEPIILTGYDVFRISRALNIKPFEFIEKYTKWHIGDSSHLPVIALKSRYDGSCSLLRKGKCTVQEYKPIVCAIYPLGRMFIAREEENFGYFKQQFNCGIGTGEEQSLKDYLNRFKVHDWDEASILWAKTIARCAMAIKDINTNSDLFIEITDIFFHVFYEVYDINKDYLTQFKWNIGIMEKIFKSLEIKL